METFYYKDEIWLKNEQDEFILLEFDDSEDSQLCSLSSRGYTRSLKELTEPVKTEYQLYEKIYRILDMDQVTRHSILENLELEKILGN